MYEVMKGRLEQGGYTLANAQARIDYLVAQGRITPDEAAELQGIAEAKADVPSETAMQVEALTARQNMLEDCLVEMAMIVYAGDA